MAGYTAGLRFGRITVKQIQEKLIGTQNDKLKFLSVWQVPVSNQIINPNYNLSKCVNETLTQKHSLSCSKFGHNGDIFGGMSHYHVDNGTQEATVDIIERSHKVMCDKFKISNNNFVSTIDYAAATNTSIRSTLVLNSTGIKPLFERILRQFNKLYKRKAFLHWYKAEGMDEMEFTEAGNSLMGLIDSCTKK